MLIDTDVNRYLLNIILHLLNCNIDLNDNNQFHNLRIIQKLITDSTQLTYNNKI